MFGTLDPGQHGAWALFYDGPQGVGSLYACGLYDRHGLPANAHASVLVVELPHGGEKHTPGVKASRADVIQLAFTAGRQTEMIGRLMHAGSVVTVFPNEWKGTVNKEVFTRRIIAAMYAQERAYVDSLALPKSYAHNVYDAIGIGLWRLGRLPKGGTRALRQSP